MGFGKKDPNKPNLYYKQNIKKRYAHYGLM